MLSSVTLFCQVSKINQIADKRHYCLKCLLIAVATLISTHPIMNNGMTCTVFLFKLVPSFPPYNLCDNHSATAISDGAQRGNLSCQYWQDSQTLSNLFRKGVFVNRFPSLFCLLLSAEPCDFNIVRSHPSQFWKMFSFRRTTPSWSRCCWNSFWSGRCC